MPRTRDRCDRGISLHEQCTRRKGYAEKSGQLRAAKVSRAEILIADAQERVKRDPTDLKLRFELGENFFNAGRFREAVPELQRARQNPHARLKAMNVLGCCYSELGMLDLGNETTRGSLAGNLVHGRDEEGDRLQSRPDLRANG